MADNVEITAGSGTSVATDDIGGAQYQRVKIGLGADGSATDMVGGAGAVSSAVIRATLASDDPGVTALQVIDDWDESDRAKVNPIVGQAGVAAGAGSVSATTQRATLASDDPAVAALQIMDDWDESDRAKVNPIAGQAGVAAGAGSVSALVQRMTLASDDPAVTALQIMDDWDESDRAKVNIIAGQAGIAGGTGVDGATVPRVTLATNVALPAGTNAIGKLAANSGVDIGDVDVTSISAGENHLGEVGGKTAVVSVTLSTDTSAYGSGDLIADTQQIDGFFRKTDGTGVINSINIIDEDAQGVALYVIFMSTATSLGSENSAPNITDANLTAGFQGIVAVATTDYVTLSGTKVATIRNIGLPVKAVSGTDDLYIAVLNSTGTPTFTASGLEMRIGAFLD